MYLPIGVLLSGLCLVLNIVLLPLAFLIQLFRFIVKINPQFILFLILGPIILIASTIRDFVVMTRGLYRKILIAEFVDNRVFLTQNIVKVLQKVCEEEPEINFRKFMSNLS